MSMQSRKLDARGMPLHPHDPARRARATSFAAVLVLIVGVFHVVQGLAALLGDAYFESPKGYFVSSDMVSTWAWAHLLLGIAAVAAGWFLRQRAMWARGVAVMVVTLSMFVPHHRARHLDHVGRVRRRGPKRALRRSTTDLVRGPSLGSTCNIRPIDVICGSRCTPGCLPQPERVAARTWRSPFPCSSSGPVAPSSARRSSSLP